PTHGWHVPLPALAGGTPLRSSLIPWMASSPHACRRRLVAPPGAATSGEKLPRLAGASHAKPRRLRSLPRGRVQGPPASHASTVHAAAIPVKLIVTINFKESAQG